VSVLYTAGGLPNVALALRNGKPIRVLALGPFPSGGFGSGPGAPKYTVQLRAELERVFAGAKLEVEARRLPGEITAGAPEYITNTVMDIRPDLVVWSAGMHDAMARAEIKPFTDVIGEILTWLRAQEIDVVVVEPPYAAAVEGDEHYSALVKSLRGVARQHEVPVVLRYDAMRYLARQQIASAEQHFELHDLSRRCAPEFTGKAISAALRQSVSQIKDSAVPQ
jgi:hypothetical protein